MSLKKLWYQSVKLFLKVSLQFFSKEIKVIGRERVPEKGAVLFAINHPNALMDPLYVTANNPRENHFLVRADVFKRPFIKKLLATLNLMPIYRIRDGRNQIANNQEIFEKCFEILKNEETLFIFPQGGHSRDRTIPQLSKGFTRIVFGALEKHKNLNVQVLPVGITYQNSSVFPTKVSVHFGNPIDAREIFDNNSLPKAINILKATVTEQLKNLSVHIPKDEHYVSTLQKLNDANVDFTEVDYVNELIRKKQFPSKKGNKKNGLKAMYYLILINGIIPYLIWKKVKGTIKQIEFVDTLKYGVHVILVPLFYAVQASIIALYFGNLSGILYFFGSLLLVYLYAKFAPSHTES